MLSTRRLSGLTQSGPQIDTTAPMITSIVELPSSGDLDAGKTVTLTLNLSEAVTVAGGTPTLTLNDGGTATYTGGSGTNALTFSYTVGAGQNTSALTATAVNLNSAISPMVRQCRQSVDQWPDPGWPADRYHGTGDQFDCGVTFERRPQCRQDRDADAQS